MTKNTALQNEIAILETKYSKARSNLLVMIVLTAVNVLILLLGSETMFLFSATVPYLIAVFGMLTEVTPLVIMAVITAVLIVAVYLLCWIFSKKHYAWMIVALVLFSIDSLIMLGFYLLAWDMFAILDIAIHAAMLFFLISGVINGKKLKSLPLEAAVETEQAAVTEPSLPIRIAEDVKHRVLIEGDFNGRHICFRRVKRVNELVIDGNVYDDTEMLVESPHVLSANIGGNIIEAGFDGTHSFIKVDGVQIAKKLRLI